MQVSGKIDGAPFPTYSRCRQALIEIHTICDIAAEGAQQTKFRRLLKRQELTGSECA